MGVFLGFGDVCSPPVTSKNVRCVRAKSGQVHREKPKGICLRELSRNNTHVQKSFNPHYHVKIDIDHLGFSSIFSFES